jgi:hypothetical protein
MYNIPVVLARGGAEVALCLYYKTFSSIELACAMGRAPAGPVRACFVREWCGVQRPHLKLHMSCCTLRTPHFALRTDTSHSARHLISFELCSPHLSCSHVISSLLIWHQSSSQIFSFHLRIAQPFSSHRSSS